MQELFVFRQTSEANKASLHIYKLEKYFVVQLYY